MKKSTRFLKRSIAVFLTVLMLVTAAPLGGLSGLLRGFSEAFMANAVSTEFELKDLHVNNQHTYALLCLSSDETGISKFNKANNYCKSLGGHLATIMSSEENTYILNLLIEDSVSDAYFGYYRTNGTWSAVTTENSGYENWAAIQLSIPDSSYAFASINNDSSGAWYETTISSSNKYFVCEWDYIISELTDGIPADAGAYQHHNYFVYGGLTSWAEAKAFCEAKGGYLAVISSAAENTYIFNYITSMGYDGVYFGYTDHDQEGVWRWVNNESSSYENWATGEGNSQNDDEDYAMFYWKYPNGNWNDGDFNGGETILNEYFICEWKDTAHELIAVEAIAPNCVSSGQRAYWLCSVCSKLFADQRGRIETNISEVYLPPLGHDWDEWVDNGDDHIRTCNRCSAEETADHVWDDGVVTKEATCKEQGSTLFTCTVCEATKTEPIAINPDNHANYGTHLENAAEPFCLVAGYTGDTVCNGCGATLEEGEAIVALGHDWDEWVDNGDDHIRTCNRCGAEETADHVWDDGVVTKEATCKEQGSKLFTCTVCEATKTEPIAINPDNHADYGTHLENAAEPFCLVTGYTGDTVCNGCGATLQEGETIAALGHDWGAWSASGENHIHSCQRTGCGATETKAHVWSEWETVTEATYDEDGLEKRVCTDCAAQETRPINKLQSWTVTFVVNDENGDFQYEGTTYSVVGKPVRFTSVDDVINPPAVPTLEGFVGKWQDFTLTENDLVVPAVYTKKADEEESELVTQKSSSYENGIAEITLDAFAKTNNVKTELGAKPYDIVLVVDQSGSMAYVMNADREPNARYGETAADTRNAKLKSVANSFVNMVAETGLDHRIAIVGFGMASKAASGLSAYQNTAVLTPGKTQFGLNQNMQSAYENAFVSVKTDKATLTETINGIQAKGATAADLGFEMAKGILANTDSTGRKRLVIFLTDGEPTYSSGFEDDVANRTVNYSYLLKNVYDATVYSIAISGKANPNDETQNFNKFLHQTSSNYPFAKFGESGAAAAQKAYYYATTDATELENIFKDVFASTVSNTISFDKVTLYDTISKYFTLTVSQEEALRAELKARYGASAEDIEITRNADGTTSLSICVAPKAVFENNIQTGYGATVTFRVSANENAVNAGYYDTNTADAGVLDADGNAVAAFDVPKIYIPQNRVFVTFRAGDEIYEIRDVRADEEIVAPQSSLGVWNIEPGTTVTENGTVFEAVLNNNERIIKWNTGSESIVQSYKIGQLVYAPEVQAPEGMSFAGWDNAVPNRMPTMNLEFTATFTRHSHDWKKVATVGDCESGMTTSYCCICGKTKQESTAPTNHTYTAIITRELDESVVTMTCTVCGAYTTKHINYLTQYDKENKDRWGRIISSTTTTVELTLYNAQNVTVQPDADEPITVYVPITAEQKAAQNNLKVYRIEEGDRKTQVNAEVVGDYIVLHLDHFSYYVITETESEMPTYGQAVCSVKGHSYTETVTPPTCTAKGYTTHTCQSCGDTYTDNETPLAAHTLIHIDAKAATTESEGSVAYYHCSICGKNFSDKNGVNELSKVTTDKLQKQEEPTTEKPKEDTPQKDYSLCKYCGKAHTGAFGWLIKIIHSILALFGLRK